MEMAIVIVFAQFDEQSNYQTLNIHIQNQTVTFSAQTFQSSPTLRLTKLFLSKPNKIR